MRKIPLTWIFFLALSLSSGCAQVATSGAQIIYNHHSFKKSVDDQLITLQANQALYIKSTLFQNTSINISTYNAEVLLAGQVPTAWQKKQAEETVKAIPNVEHVYNFITVSPPPSTLKQVSDAWLTTKVKAKLVASEDVDGSKVKVVTEDGTVYLMGTLQQEEAQAAVEIASSTDGVENVVKIFSYIHIKKIVDG
ncbi:MAG: hypothetical protein A3E84_01840 [Gammaproteobacteria bacterium RIFCSPHIGHO2_12_FULL_42_13]|nr:MAG: hypothetical protein A3E84_01840 [Gammaproteobacteria bacterium RIFCSPHIGHO2_12_FULL_42_13]